MFDVKQFLKILKLVPVILARVAHVIEHIFCDDVPHIGFFDEEDDKK